MVQPFDGRVLSDAALSRAAGGPELDSSGGESLGSFGQSRSSSRPEPHSGPVEHEQLATQAFNPMPGLRTGVIELAATVTASGEREGDDDNDKHHRDQHHRGYQHCGHGLDGTRRRRVAVAMHEHLALGVPMHGLQPLRPRLYAHGPVIRSERRCSRSHP